MSNKQKGYYFKSGYREAAQPAKETTNPKPKPPATKPKKK